MKNKINSEVKVKLIYLVGILFSLFLSANVLAADGTGGNITHITEGGLNYTVHIFTTNGTFVPPMALDVSVLVVGGGGGAGTSSGNYRGGGGGAGGYISQNLSIATGTYPVVVGTGGAVSNNGLNSSFNNLIAVGGGAGGNAQTGLGVNGGSGGGAASLQGTAGNGTAGQGNNGGGGSGGYNAGGGGGAGGNGSAGWATACADGGVGVSNSINGTAIIYATGGNASQSCAVSAMIPNRGDGGYSSNVGSIGGGSGVVIVRYLSSDIQFTSNSTSGNVTQSWIFANFSYSNESAIVSSIIRLYNSSNMLINSSISRGVNFTSLSDGAYYVNITVTNLTGQNLSTETRTVYLDNFAPAFTSLSPTNNTPIGNSLVNFSSNISDANGIKNTTLSIFRNGALFNKTYFNDNKINTNYVGATYSLSFDGNNDYVTISDSPGWDFGANNFTVSWWEYRSSSGGCAIARDDILYSSFLLGFGGNAVYMTSGDGSWSIANGRTIGNAVVGSWQHIVVARNGTTFKTYRNTVQQDTWESATALRASSNSLQIGRAQGANYFNGRIDEFLIFNRSLNSTEISQLYNNGTGLYADISIAPFNSGLVSAYHFEEGNGTTTIDITGRNNGTLTNGPTYTTGKVLPFGDWINYTSGSLSSIFSRVYNLIDGVYTWFFESYDILNKYNTSGNLTLTVDATAPQISFASSSSGGNITYDGAYTVHTFLSNGTFVPPTGVTNVSVLVVAGGGAGGIDRGGGGGAGGLIYNSSYPVTTGSYSVVVGAGGTPGNNGGNSSIGTLIAIGGGRGGIIAINPNQNGATGGSGGGAGSNGGSGGPIGGPGTAGQGTAGANSYGATDNPRNTGGGGGAGGSGIGGTTAPNGGVGLNYIINGSNVYYGGGGGGGDPGWDRSSYGKGTGGSGIGGGGGGKTDGDKNGVNGLDSTGSGGGGAGYGSSAGTAGSGGSGIVIVRYLTPTLIVSIVTEENNSVKAQDYIYAEVNLVESNFANITFSLYNTSLVNSTNYSTAITNITWTNLANGIYYYNVSACDIFGRCNSTETRMITLDTTAPNATLLYPVNNTTVGDVGVNFTANVTDNFGVQNATLHLLDVNNQSLSNHTFGDTRFANEYLSFDGSDDYVSKTSPVGLENNDYTYNVWVNLNLLGTSKMAMGVGDGPTGDQFIGVIDSNKIYFGSYYDGGAQGITGLTTLTTGTWYMLTATRNSLGNLEVYLNGAQEASSAVGNPMAIYGTIELNIGSRVGAYQPFNGQIDAVTIFNRSLSQSEISNLYSAGRGATISTSLAPYNDGLVAGYDFEGDSGTTLTDKSGNGNDGTLVNGPVWESETAGSYTLLGPGITETVIGIVVTLTDGIYNWFYDIFDWAGNQFNTEINQVTVDMPPAVTLVSPTAGLSLNTISSLACSATDGFGVSNITLYIWNESGLIYENTVDAVSATLFENTWNYDLTDGNYTYNCLARDITLGAAGWAASNISTQVDASTYSIANGNFENGGNVYYNPAVITDITFNVTSTSVVDQDLTFNLLPPVEFSDGAYKYMESGSCGGSNWNWRGYPAAICDTSVLTDGNWDTYYGLRGTYDNYIRYDLASPSLVNKIKISWANSPNWYGPGSYYFQYYDSNIGDWVTPSEWNSYGYMYQDLNTEHTLTLSTPVTAQYIRLVRPNSGGNSGIAIREMEVWSDLSPSGNAYFATVGSTTPTYTILANNVTQVTFPLNIYSGSDFDYPMQVDATRTRFDASYNYSSPIYNIHFIYDASPPTLVGNINYAPSNLALIDPNTFVQLNATMTDAGIGLANATFQSYYDGTWHDLPTERIGSYSNGGIFGANFTSASVNKNYSIRLWSVDLVGNEGYTSSTLIRSEWDCTWNMSKVSSASLGEFFGWEEKVNFANFTIYNTGDLNYTDMCPLQMTVTHNLPRSGDGSLRIDDVAGTSRTYENVTAGETVNVKLYFDYRSQIYSDSLRLEIEEDSAKTSIAHTDNLTSTLFSTNGPYLYQAISDPVVLDSNDLVYRVNSSYYRFYLSNETVLFNLSLRNGVGDGTVNKTAYNVTHSFIFDYLFNFTNISEADNVTATNLTELNLTNSTIANVTFFYNNVSDGDSEEETHYNSLELNLTDFVELVNTSNNYFFKLNSYGYNSTGSEIVHANDTVILEDSFFVKFFCYTTSDGFCVNQCDKDLFAVNETNFDPDCAYCGDGIVNQGETCASCEKDAGKCPPATTGGPGGSGGPSSGGGGSFDKSSATFELVRGENQEFELMLENKLSNPKKDITITVKGNNSQYVIPSPNMISYLGANSKEKVKFLINAPSYFGSGKYLLEITFTGFIEGNTSTKFTEVRYVTLTILEMNRVTADEYLNNSLDILSKMNSSGLILSEVQSILDSMNVNYESLNFMTLKEEAAKIEAIYNAATEYAKLRDELNQSMIESEKNGVETSETKKLFLLAEILFNRGDYVAAYAKMKEAKTSYLLETKGEFKLLYAIKNNPVETLGILVSLSAIGVGSGYFLRLRLLKRKLRMLTEEEGLLLQLMRVVQRDCFESNKMSMEEYGEAMYQYEARLSFVIQDKVTTETQLANLMKLGGKKKALGQEKDRLTMLIRQTQDDYMNRGKLDTRIYENMLKTYATRLSKIEEQLVFIEAQEQINQVSGFWNRMFG